MLTDSLPAAENWKRELEDDGGDEVEEEVDRTLAESTCCTTDTCALTVHARD